MNAHEETCKFLDVWTTDPNNARSAFIKYRDFLAALPATTLEFKARPGISYSLRARNDAQKKRELFVLVDVVDDEPDNRWLSVCFYADMVTDPDEKGDFVPDGLMGENAICFNLEDNDIAMRDYIGERLAEAAKSAAKPEK